jgi:integrase
MTTTMKHLVQEYLDERRGLGFALEVSGSQLMAFAHFADASRHRGPLTCQLITSWARDKAKRATPLTWARRLGIIRPFAKHRARIEPGTMCPRPIPSAAASLGPAPVYKSGDRRSAWRRRSALTERNDAAGNLSFPVGLIAATGLRVSEALRLECADVDLDAGMLTVRQTKFARLVPLNPTTVRALKHYLAIRQRHLPTVPDGPFLASVRGTALAKSSVHRVFAELRDQLGWTARGGHVVPRIHD